MGYINEDSVKFGRLESKEREYEEKYSFYKLNLPVAKTSEVTLNLPFSLRPYYDQGAASACVGYSCSWMQSIYNNNPLMRYDALWLYHEAQLSDKDPNTTPEADNGTYVWAAMDVLKKKGHKKVSDRLPDVKDGITNYYWCKNADNIRTALSVGRPVVIGIPWYMEFMNPRTIKGEAWIGTSPTLGKALGGHAICIFATSDKRQAVRLVNTWGLKYPQVWLSYSVLNRLLSEGGEAVAGIDNVSNT